MKAAGFVLTGGNSTRMGRDKALLPWNDAPLVQSVAATLATVADPVVLVGQPQRYTALQWPCLQDLRPDSGPLAGIETALTHTELELNLIVACDMPGLQQSWLKALLERAKGSPQACIALRDRTGFTHPLCAVYRTACLPLVAKALDQGRLKLMSLLAEIGAEYLSIDAEVENMNTPVEWANWHNRTGA